jgi:hypothetical protein
MLPFGPNELRPKLGRLLELHIELNLHPIELFCGLASRIQQIDHARLPHGTDLFLLR